MSAVYVLFHCYGKLELWSMQKWHKPGMAVVQKETWSSVIYLPWYTSLVHTSTVHLSIIKTLYSTHLIQMLIDFASKDWQSLQFFVRKLISHMWSSFSKSSKYAQNVVHVFIKKNSALSCSPSTLDLEQHFSVNSKQDFLWANSFLAKILIQNNHFQPSARICTHILD